MSPNLWKIKLKLKMILSSGWMERGTRKKQCLKMRNPLTLFYSNLSILPQIEGIKAQKQFEMQGKLMTRRFTMFKWEEPRRN